MTAKALHVSRLAVAPAQVLTITVDAEPISLALYQQLPHRPLWRRTDDDGALIEWIDADRPLGSPWGQVVVHPDVNCASASEHWHIVGALEDTHDLVVDVVMGWMTTDRLAVVLDAMPRLVVGI